MPLWSFSMNFLVLLIICFSTFIPSCRSFVHEHPFEPDLVSRADTSSSGKPPSKEIAGRKELVKDWTENRFHEISSPTEQYAVFGGVQSELPWAESHPSSATIQALMDDYAEAKYGFLLNKVKPSRRSASGLLVALLYLESSKKIYVGSIPYGHARDILHLEFDGDTELKYNQWQNNLHAEHLAVGIARMSGDLKTELNGKERRYLAVYGSISPTYTGPNRWKHPCPYPDQPDANDPTCQTWLKSLSISFLGDTASMKTPEPGSPQGSPASPPRKKTKTRRSLAGMEEMLDMILEIRDAMYVDSDIPAWIDARDYAALSARDFDILDEDEDGIY